MPCWAGPNRALGRLTCLSVQVLPSSSGDPVPDNLPHQALERTPSVKIDQGLSRPLKQGLSTANGLMARRSTGAADF